MPTVTSWFTADRADDWQDLSLATVRAGDVTREIADEPVEITIRRAGVAQPAQTVRLLQPPARGQELGSTAGEEGEADLVVLGESDLDIQREDRFLVDSQLYEVIYVAPGQSNRVEAKARQVQ